MISHLIHLGASPALQSASGLISGAAKKMTDALKLYLGSRNFLNSLDKAGITPNNLVTFRIALMVSGAVAYILQKDTGAVMMTVSCVLDSTDGKLARNYNKKSKEGELYDPASDKISEILLSLVSYSNLSFAQSGVQLPAMFARMYFHYKSQFSEKRGTFSEQMKTFKRLILEGDKNTQFLEKVTGGAANTSGKWKTALQFTSGLGIVWLHTGVAQELLKILVGEGIPVTLEEVCDFLTWIFIGAGIVSLPLAMKSIYGREGVKGQKKMVKNKVEKALH